MNYEDQAHSAWMQHNTQNENVTLAKVAPRYNRSPIFSFFDLTEEEQANALREANDENHAQERSYVYHDRVSEGHDVLPLDMFIRLENSKIWHGVYGTSYFSAYFVRLNRSNDEALVAEKFS